MTIFYSDYNNMYTCRVICTFSFRILSSACWCSPFALQGVNRHMHACTYTHTHSTHAHTARMHKQHTHAHTNVNTHACTHMQMHARTHAHTHAHTHTSIHPQVCGTIFDSLTKFIHLLKVLSWRSASFCSFRCLSFSWKLHQVISHVHG